MNTNNEINHLVAKAEAALSRGNVEAYERLIAKANELVAKSRAK